MRVQQIATCSLHPTNTLIVQRTAQFNLVPADTGYQSVYGQGRHRSPHSG